MTLSRKSSICGRADKVLAATAAALAASAGSGLIGTTEQSDAGIIASVNVNIDVPFTFAGVYLDVVTNATSTTGSFAGYDINPWGTGGAQFFGPFSGGTWASATAGGTPLSLTPGTLVSAATTPWGGSTNAVVNGVNGWALPGDNYVGFRFTNSNTNVTNYGWLLTRNIAANTSTGAPASRTIVSYAYEDTGAGINVAAVPEPTALTMIATGIVSVVTLRGRRRSKVA
jgi:hypothetical protein